MQEDYPTREKQMWDSLLAFLFHCMQMQGSLLSCFHPCFVSILLTVLPYLKRTFSEKNSLSLCGFERFEAQKLNSEQNPETE